MKKYLKYLWCLGLLGLSGSVYAEGGSCPSGYYPIGDANAPGCAPIPGAENQQSSYQQAAPPPPVPTGEWRKTWGAIASDQTTGDAGTITGMRNEKDAISEALRRCSNVGSRNCKILLTYQNQCAAAAWGAGYMLAASAPDVREAEARALKGCSGNKKSNECKVVYSECSKPEFIHY